MRSDMNTPIADFIREYVKQTPVRLHMPGHKGRGLLGCEAWDITEIPGADELYAPTGIIRESENNAAALFNSGRTLYSTEGSSQCIRAMISLVATRARTMQRSAERSYILATRNAHKTFLYALALTDLDVEWLMPEASESLCSCRITAEDVTEALRRAPTPPVAVYVTSPDYLGRMLPLREIAAVCHAAGLPLLVDNAHGAYLRFLPEDMHPLAAGADMCCDSAHKTLPALTGTAYLHISRNAPSAFAAGARDAMALYGSTSPSYLLLASLDMCNRTLAENFREMLADRAKQVAMARRALRAHGWSVEDTEPLKLTIRAPANTTGEQIATRLRQTGYQCEYADREYVVMMPSVATTEQELAGVVSALGDCAEAPAESLVCHLPPATRVLSVRDAILAPSEVVPVAEACGRICASPTVSCPPAIPIAVSGEVIQEAHLLLFEQYGIRQVSVVRREYAGQFV